MTEKTIKNLIETGHPKHVYGEHPPIPQIAFIKDLPAGVKNDNEKNRLELVPTELITSVGEILTFGAKKYSDRNWEKGMAWSRVYGALQRHLNTWWAGERADAETGKSHLWHAGCCIAFLITYELRGTGQDDRPLGKS